MLVVDADTVLLRPRTWLAGNRQLLLPAHEFYPPYEAVFLRTFGKPCLRPRLSWIAHHQLMRPTILARMLGPTAGDRVRELRGWIAASAASGGEALSEHHAYGRWLESFAPREVVLGRWGNRAVPRSLLAESVAAGEARATIERLRHSFPTALSVSLHSYL